MKDDKKLSKLKRLPNKNTEEAIRIMESLSLELKIIVKRVDVLKNKIKK